MVTQLMRTIQSNDDMPDAKVQMSANVAYYLPRKDKLTLTKDRVLKVIEGFLLKNRIYQQMMKIQ